MTIEQAETTAIESPRDMLRGLLGSWIREWLLLARGVGPRLLPDPSLTCVGFAREQILVRRNGCSEEIAISAGGEAEGGAPIGALRLHASGAGNIELEFPEADILRPAIRLPRTKRNVLDKALYFELARISPIEVGELYFDYRLQPARADGSEVLARLRVVRRRIVDGAVASCHAAGLSIARIRLGGDGEAADWRMFPIDRAALLLVVWEKVKLVSLAALALLLAYLVALAAYSRGNARLADISVRIAAAQADAAEAARLRSQSDQLARAQFFLDTQRRKPLFAYTLAQLSRGLPQDSWATGLQLTGKRMRLQGYSRSTSHLVSDIGDMGFRNPQFEAPVTRDSSTKAERFDLSFEVSR